MSSHHHQEILQAQFSLYVLKGGQNPIHFILFTQWYLRRAISEYFVKWSEILWQIYASWISRSRAMSFSKKWLLGKTQENIFLLSTEKTLFLGFLISPILSVKKNVHSGGVKFLVSPNVYLMVRPHGTTVNYRIFCPKQSGRISPALPGNDLEMLEWLYFFCWWPDETGSFICHRDLSSQDKKATDFTRIPRDTFSCKCCFNDVPTPPALARH